MTRPSALCILMFLGLAAADAAMAAGPELPPCTCRGRAGAQMPLGAQMCLATPNGPRLATCVMALNNTSWAPTDEACPQTSWSPRRLSIATILRP